MAVHTNSYLYSFTPVSYTHLIHVIFGVEGLKIHSKLVHIGTRHGDIACISTGNFHEGNARM